jgi:hypothetical protein
VVNLEVVHSKHSYYEEKYGSYKKKYEITDIIKENSKNKRKNHKYNTFPRTIFMRRTKI